MSEAAPSTSETTHSPRCQNCGTVLLGEHCYACGQPIKGLVRHFTSIVGDFFDSVFELDSRILRTLGPLFLRPGFLSTEYFAGRRVRYVSPVRLFVFLSLVAFFVAQLSTDWSGVNPIENDAAIARATTAAEVERLRDVALVELEKARAESATVPGVGTGLKAAEIAVREQADKRLAELRKAEEAGQPPPTPDPKPSISFGDTPWDPETNPVEIAGLPKPVNAWFNRQIARAEDNVERVQQDPNLLKDAMLGAVPSTLFVLLPLFALLLKFLYVFKRRLYMEHLIVALHSHAFLCLALLLAFLTMDLQGWLAPEGSALHGVFGGIVAALYAWMPLYLLLAQKRIYGQGWLLTLFKFGLLGFCYVMLLSFGAAFTVLASLVWL